MHDIDDKLDPTAEARGLIALVRSGKETLESVRKFISTPERRAVRLLFDVLAMRLSANRKRLCQHIKPYHVSKDLRNRLARMMMSGWSKKEIRRVLPVSWRLLDHIAREVHPSFYKRGCGRRLTAEMKEQLQAAITQGWRPSEIRRKFKVSYPTISDYRRAMGLHEDCRFRKKLSPEQLAEAEQMLRSGEKWITTANKFGVYESTLLERITYRKRGEGNR